MNRLVSLAVTAVVGLGQGMTAQAADISAAIGQTDEGTMTASIATQFDFEHSWMQSDTGRLTGCWDANYTYWDGNRGDGGNNSLAFAPVFIYEFATGGIKPFIEAGIGVALFSDTRVDGNDLSTAFQFEDRLGFGVRFSGQQVGLRAVHYSNAGIKDPNDGVENYSLYYRTSL